MKDESNHQQAVELLQQLGLKEYEARCLVALSRTPEGTAKEISEISEVPRTRVYDAIRVLESKGLVEIQHSNPQLFRAVPIEEAAETLRQEYESRTETLVETISTIEPARTHGDDQTTHEIWTLNGTSAVENRTQQLIENADEEIVLVIGHEAALTENLIEQLQAAQSADVRVLVGTSNDAIREQIDRAISDATIFVSQLDWLDSSPIREFDDTIITRLLLVDRETILVSSAHETESGSFENERAVFGHGFDNGIVVIARRLMATGLLQSENVETGRDEAGIIDGSSEIADE
ncbi:TrmB family transcriptional regulator [Haladaptatus sp. CMAA 1911]|uniref:TrmB family transcriptional regulator n=1 Tax=unclassified Haladaptatus TaxID=2622732 RepID=UPI003754B890